MRAVLPAILILVLLVAGCTQKYAVIEKSGLPNPPSEKLDITIKVHIVGTGLGMKKDQIAQMVGRELKKDEVLAADFGSSQMGKSGAVPVRYIKNPFRVVYDNPVFHIEARGQIFGQEDDYGYGEEGTVTSATRVDKKPQTKFEYTITVKEVATDREIFKKSYMNYFVTGPGTIDNAEIVKRLILGAILERKAL